MNKKSYVFGAAVFAHQTSKSKATMQMWSELYALPAPLMMALVSSVLFVCTAAVGVWAAYDPVIALIRFSLIVAGVLVAARLVWGRKRSKETLLGKVGMGCALLSALISIYFIATGHTAWRIEAEGSLAVLFPLGVGGLGWAWIRRRRRYLMPTALALVITAATILLAFSKGALLGLGAGAISAGLLCWRSGADPRDPRHWIADVMLLGGILVLLGVFVAALSLPLADGRISGFAVGSSLYSRALLWQNALVLLQDYPFTGSGLGNSAMIFSTYVFLIHVPYIHHAYNLYLQIAIEQGIPGLVAFLSLTSAAAWALRRAMFKTGRSYQIFYAASVAAFVTVLVQGMVDADVYAGPLVPVMFLPFGFAFALPRIVSRHQHPLPTLSNSAPIKLWGAALPLMGIGMVLLAPGARMAMLTNWGAVLQTKAELKVYHWPEWPIQDLLRHDRVVDLMPSITYYRTALQIDAENGVAHRRLGQIALSRGDYEQARQHLVAAYSVAPNQNITRRLLGEVYAVLGNVEQAAHLWRSSNIDDHWLEMRHWWYTYIGATQEAEWIHQAIEMRQPS